MWQNASSISIKGKSKAYFFQGDFANISKQEILRIKLDALSDPLGRVRYCLHESPEDLLHYMVIGSLKGTYVQPHRHIKSSVFYQIIEGRLEVLMFDSGGNISHRFNMDAKEKHSYHFVRLNPNVWHTEIYLSEVAIFCEVIAASLGKEANPVAPWAPDESDEQACQEYLAKLMDTDS